MQSTNTRPFQHEIRVRSIGIDDWPLWRSLRLQALEEAPYAFSSRLADWQGRGDTEARWRGRVSDVPLNIVAELQEAAAGMASGTAPNPDGSVELISMWVAPFARGRGVGHALLNAVIEWAREQQASRVALGVLEGKSVPLPSITDMDSFRSVPTSEPSPNIGWCLKYLRAFIRGQVEPDFRSRSVGGPTSSSPGCRPLLHTFQVSGVTFHN